MSPTLPRVVGYYRLATAAMDAGILTVHRGGLINHLFQLGFSARERCMTTREHRNDGV